jgi:hypothetical protein
MGQRMRFEWRLPALVDDWQTIILSEQPNKYYFPN